MAASAEYLELLRHPLWQKKRSRILERDDWRCVWCRDTEHNLQVHHKIYARGGKPWEVADGSLVTLCETCHRRITDLRRRANAVLSDLNVYELPTMVAMMESMVSTNRSAVSSVHLERLAGEKEEILTRPYSRAGSRRVDVIDAELEDIWEHLQEAKSA